MTNPTSFVQPKSCFPLTIGKKRVGTITVGGPELLMPVGLRTVLFEMHQYFGPVPMSKTTGSALANIPRGFWDAFERWEAGGKLVVESLCVCREWCSRCEGLGDETRQIIGRHYEVLGPCKRCNGDRLEPIAAKTEGGAG